jgi:hypoxanthine phosphoribosyltransferase
MSNKLWYSWEEMRRDVNVLCRDIVLDKFDPEVIVGLSRGGLVPSVMMSHWFKKPLKPVVAAMRDFPEWEEYLPRPTDKRVLIVDDICDSAETLKRIADHIKFRSKSIGECDVRFATLWWNNETNFEPHYWAQSCAKNTLDIWLQFPWDHWNVPIKLAPPTSLYAHRY